MKKANKKAPKCIVCQGGKGNHLCPSCRRSLADLQRRNHHMVMYDEDTAAWAARRAVAGQRDVAEAAHIKVTKACRAVLRELLPSLAWAPHSSHHHEIAARLLLHLGISNPSAVLREYEDIRLQSSQEGSPKEHSVDEDEAPELTNEFFASPIVTKPGDDVIAVVQQARAEVAENEAVPVAPSTEAT